MNKVRLGMVGGGPGAFIGAVHRNAAWLDGGFDLVAGAFSASPSKSAEQGRLLSMPDNRVYESFDAMFAAERNLPSEARMQAVAIVTPNHTHFEIADKALRSGFHVICDKPMTHRLGDAKALVQTVMDTGLVFALTHNYTGYPMVKEARELVRSGELGRLRKVIVEYTQGWLADPIEQHADIWRTDPARGGASGCMGDIGTHAFNLLEYISGQAVTEVCAELTSFVPGRELDDDGNVLLRLNGGARGVLHASQVCIGEENDLSIKLYGDKAGLVWRQQEPNMLTIKSKDGVDRIKRAGVNHANSPAAFAASRIPGGHPEGFIEAFANIYREFAASVRVHEAGESRAGDFPDVMSGLRGMTFIDALIKNTNGIDKWTEL